MLLIPLCLSNRHKAIYFATLCSIFSILGAAIGYAIGLWVWWDSPNEFSNFARMPKPILKKIDLNDIISRTIDIQKLAEKDIKFSLTKKKSVHYSKGDEEQLNRVFINLIKNSIESISEKKRKNADFKGKISVEIKEDSDYIYVTIIDNGVGFDQVDKAQMLTPYFTTKKKGTGLGLAIVSKVISDHNSTILFDSIDDGAKIEIILPRYHG